mmetsp:Transcript_50185/g.115862  ORF Transcript_50185/g.115862 Transcript_50185/m.115862 type:complete len:227 (+) Transcript_50185:866-1546(+)
MRHQCARLTSRSCWKGWRTLQRSASASTPHATTCSAWGSSCTRGEAGVCRSRVTCPSAGTTCTRRGYTSTRLIGSTRTRTQARCHGPPLARAAVGSALSTTSTAQATTRMCTSTRRRQASPESASSMACAWSWIACASTPVSCATSSTSPSSSCKASTRAPTQPCTTRGRRQPASPTCASTSLKGHRRCRRPHRRSLHHRHRCRLLRPLRLLFHSLPICHHHLHRD